MCSTVDLKGTWGSRPLILKDFILFPGEGGGDFDLKKILALKNP